MLIDQELNHYLPVWPSEFFQSKVERHIPEVRFHIFILLSRDPEIMRCSSNDMQVTASWWPYKVARQRNSLKLQT